MCKKEAPICSRHLVGGEKNTEAAALKWSEELESNTVHVSIIELQNDLLKNRLNITMYPFISSNSRVQNFKVMEGGWWDDTVFEISEPRNQTKINYLMYFFLISEVCISYFFGQSKATKPLRA